MGGVLRIAYVFALRADEVGGDGWAYHLAAIGLHEGGGFFNPLTQRPSADHPPLWTLVLALPALLGVSTPFEHQLFAALIGTATIVVIALTGRGIASERIGLLAAGIAAIYPGFWRYERELLSETLMLPAAALMTWCACGFSTRPARGRALLLGALCGALALIRSEQILLSIFLVAPLILAERVFTMRERMACLALAGIAAALVIAPWTLYNLRRFERPVLLSASMGLAMVQGNCDSTYFGSRLGYYDFGCLGPVWPDPRLRGLDGTERDPIYRDIAMSYVRDHLARLPVVLLARQGRAWSLYRPFQTSNMEALWAKSPSWVHRLAAVSFWVLLVPALASLLTLRRWAVPPLPLLAPFVVVIVSVFLTFGLPRYRASAEASLVLLAALGVDECIAGRARRRSSASLQS